MSVEQNPIDPSTEGSGDPADADATLRAERDALLAERNALESRLATLAKPKRRRGRRAVVGVLVGLSALLVPLSAVVVWTHRTLLNTDAFESTMAPIFEDPAVVNAASARATNELFSRFDVQARLQAQLPERASFIAAPVTNGAKGFVQSSLTKVMLSPKFQEYWASTLGFTHRQVVAVLRGQSTPVLSTTQGTVVLNAVPVLNQALSQVSGLASSIAGRQVTLPTISSAELPQSAVDKLDKALGITLPSTFGQITLFKSDNLAVVQRGVRAFDRLTIVLPIITICLLIASLWLSLSRRRSLIQLVAVSMLILIVLRRVLMHAEGQIAAKAQDPTAARHVFDQVLSGLFGLTAALLWIGLAILVVALVTGPYRWSVALRGWCRRGLEQLTGWLDAEHRRVALRWAAGHAGPLQFAGALTAAILLLVIGVSWVSFIVIGALLAAYEVGLNVTKEHFAPPGPHTAQSGQPAAHSGSAVTSGH